MNKESAFEARLISSGILSSGYAILPKVCKKISSVQLN